MTKRENKTVWIVVIGYIVIATLLVALGLSCNEPEKIETPAIDAVDSVVILSQSRLDTATIINHRSDSAVKVVVKEKIREIKMLQKALVEANNVHAVAAMPVERIVEKIIYRVDTVYIETEKNFWGKKKTKVTVVSDSSAANEPIDSLDNQ